MGLDIQRSDQEDKIIRNKVQNINQYYQQVESLGGVKANVVEIPKTLNSVESLKKYLNHIKKLQGQQLQTIRAEPLVAEPLLAEPLLADPLVAEPLVAEPLVALPSTSVSTMYLSGSIPGQYTTSLVTISLNNQHNENSRVKRQIKPSAHQPIMATIQVEPEDSFSEQKQGLRILSSFNEEFTFIDGKSEASEQCSDKTVTVTVTKPCLP